MYTKIVIEDGRSLKIVSDYLHDGTFGKNSYKYDPAQKKFSIKVRYQNGIKKNKKWFLFFKKIETIWQDAILMFENVLSCDEKIGEIHQEYVIADIVYSSETSTITIAMAYGGEIRIRVSGIHGFFADKSV